MEKKGKEVWLFAVYFFLFLSLRLTKPIIGIMTRAIVPRQPPPPLVIVTATLLVYVLPPVHVT